MLSTVDIVIIFCYLFATMIIGIVMRKRSNNSKDDYLLGGKSLRWYMLGLSNASGMFDISGTMWLVYLIFIYGLKSIWIPWLWPVFNQIFLMVYLAAWLRRSNVTTGAEWIFFRFGSGIGGKLAQNIVVIFAIVSCLGFLAYGFIGLGKFVEIFLPWNVVEGFVPFEISPQYVPHIYGVVFTLFAIFYSVLGGMKGIVWADILQFAIMTISSISVACIAWKATGDYSLNVPDGWLNPFFGWHLDLDWSSIIPEINHKIGSDGFSFFGIFFMLVLFKGLLASIAGPSPNYDMQKILSTKSPIEAAKMSGVVSLILLPTRYLMVGGIGIMSILFYDQLAISREGIVDFETILPASIIQLVPKGLTGIILAGLLAAFMSTFAGTLNAAQAYLVNDIYPHFSKNFTLGKTNTIYYGSGILVAIVSIILGFFVKDINSIIQWLFSALWGGYIVSNILKWHWWRFNGNGYFWGMLSGLIPAVLFPLFIEKTPELYFFPFLLLVTLAGCLVGTYLAPPTDEKTLLEFYKKTRPWGLWNYIHKKAVEEDPNFQNPNYIKRDALNILTGIISQLLLTVAPIYLILRDYKSLGIALLLLFICGLVLKKFWWKTLGQQK